MAENQLFPVFDLPEIPDNPEYDERYYPSVYFDFETGDFLDCAAQNAAKPNGLVSILTMQGRKSTLQNRVRICRFCLRL